MDEGHERFSCFVVAGCNAPGLLEAIEHPLDAIAIPVGPEVASYGLLPVGLGRDDWQDPLHEQRGSDPVAIVALVGQHHLRLGDGQSEEFVHSLVVGDLAASQDEAKGTALTVRTGVDLARKAAATSTKALLASSPFAPAA